MTAPTHHHRLFHHVDAVALHQLLEQIKDLFCPRTLECKDSYLKKKKKKTEHNDNTFRTYKDLFLLERDIGHITEVVGSFFLDHREKSGLFWDLNNCIKVRFSASGGNGHREVLYMDLFNFLTENVCSHMKVDPKRANIF